MVEQLFCEQMTVVRFHVSAQTIRATILYAELERIKINRSE